MKRGRLSTGAQGTSRNKDYYLKKVRLNDSSGIKSLVNYFKPINGSKCSNEEVQNQESEILAPEKDNGESSNENNRVLADKNNQPEENLRNLNDLDFSKSISVINREASRDDNEVEAISIGAVEEKDTQSRKKNSVKEPNVLSTVSKHERSKNWLFYSPSASGYLCKICSVVSNSKGPWITEGVDFHGHPTRVIKTHEESKSHHNSVSAISSTKKSSVIGQLQEAASKDKNKKQEINRWAVLENFEDLIQFLGCQLKDSDIKLHLETCAKNATYLSHYSVKNMLGCIAGFVEESSLTLLKSCDAFALLADESTDKAPREQLGLIARIKITNEKEVKEQFLGLINVTQTDAASIMKAIEQFMIAKGLDLKKCMFVALDGANVMSGELKGLQRRIRHYSPHCVYINCRNHRLALVFAHLLKKFSNLKSVDSLLISIWKIFHYSPQKYGVLKNIQENVYNIKTLKMLKVSTTRWLSHGKACARVSERFFEIVETLDAIFMKTREPEVKGVRELLLNPEVFLTILFLADFLKIVDRFNLWLQKKSIVFSNVNENMQALINNAEELCQNLSEGVFFTKCEELLKFSEEATLLSCKLRKGHSTISKSVMDFKTKFVCPFLEDFKSELKSAFEIKEECPLTGFDAFLPPSKDLDVSDRNDHNWSKLISYYGQVKISEFQGNNMVSAPIIDSKYAQEELSFFQREIEASVLTFEIKKLEKTKILVRKNLKEEANMCMQEKMTPLDLINILEEKQTAWDEFPNLMKLLNLCVIIPASTASVERLFSQMNLVCTKLRNRLSQNSLDMHLQIIINGPEILSDEQVDKILDVFKSSENRRISL